MVLITLIGIIVSMETSLYLVALYVGISIQCMCQCRNWMCVCVSMYACCLVLTSFHIQLFMVRSAWIDAVCVRQLFTQQALALLPSLFSVMRKRHQQSQRGFVRGRHSVIPWLCSQNESRNKTLKSIHLSWLIFWPLSSLAVYLFYFSLSVTLCSCDSLLWNNLHG